LHIVELILQVRALAKRQNAAETALQAAVMDDFKLLLGHVDVKVREPFVMDSCSSSTSKSYLPALFLGVGV